MNPYDTYLLDYKGTNIHFVITFEVRVFFKVIRGMVTKAKNLPMNGF